MHLLLLSVGLTAPFGIMGKPTLTYKDLKVH